MSAPSPPPEPYRVVYSELVRSELIALVRRAAGLDQSALVLQAIREIDRRLHVYPQFGEPLRDLAMAGETLWTGTIPPLVVQYIIDDERRLVFVVLPFKALPGLGL